MPFIVTQENETESLASTGVLELVGRQCRLANYRKLQSIPTFRVTGDMIAYASPDSTYAVTRRLFDAAKKEILIGMYDFSAGYMKAILLNALQRGVKVSLMLDIDSQLEQQIFDELKKFGGTGVEAPSCASKVISYFPSSHEKVIVIDGTWTLVQSGNYSDNGIPFNEKDGGDPAHFVTGNRDMGVAIRSRPLAAFFANLLRSDMKLELDAESLPAFRVPIPQRPELELVEEVPPRVPSKLFPSKTFNPSGSVRVRPVLTPDNYMDVIPGILEAATGSVLLEHQYIHSQQDQIVRLLTAIKKAKDKNPKLDVRIILGKIFSAADYKAEVNNIDNLQEKFGLVLGQNIRYIDTQRLVHCHNKLIIVDGTEVLVSSQNWSNAGVSSNRETGLLIQYPAIAQYYSEIFEVDWSTAVKKIPQPGPATVAVEALASGRFVKVSAADYQDV